MLQWLQPHRSEKCFAKPEEVIHSRHSMQVSFFFFFIFFFFYHLAAFAARDNFKAGDYGESEP